MTKEEIFYNKQEVRYYELFTRTTLDKNKKVKLIYEVQWHTKQYDTILDEITKEEYDVLLKELEKC
jgi:hypothetical protein